MKHLLTLILAVVASVGFSQNILVADNNPGAPSGTHIYPTLQAAINAAVAGDIIHVIPSATTYDGAAINVNKDNISIFGIGFFPDKDGPQVATFNLININASGVRLSGLNTTTLIDIGQDNGSYNGITIENSSIGYINTGTGALSNILIRSCHINRVNYVSTTSISFGNTVSNSVISNCIIDHYATGGTYENMTAYNGTIIKNCIFFGHGNNAFQTLVNCTVSNSIFYGATPTAVSSFTNNVLNHCVAVDGTGAAVDLSGYTGTGNISSLNSTQIFAEPNINIGDGSWNLTWDHNVVAPLIDAGTDNTDLGVMGGTIPFSVTGTPLPLIKRLLVPEIIKQGDNLNATIEAQGY